MKWKEGEGGGRRGKEGEGGGRRRKEEEGGGRREKEGEGGGRREKEGEGGRRREKEGEGGGRREEGGESGIISSMMSSQQAYKFSFWSSTFDFRVEECNQGFAQVSHIVGDEQGGGSTKETQNQKLIQPFPNKQQKNFSSPLKMKGPEHLPPSGTLLHFVRHYGLDTMGLDVLG